VILCYAWIDKKEEGMGRTTSEENKSEWIRFRIKPSLRQKILKLQAQGDCAQLDLQDFVMVLLCRGLKIEAKIKVLERRETEWRMNPSPTATASPPVKTGHGWNWTT
jgi:hypothetical protein